MMDIIHLEALTIGLSVTFLFFYMFAALCANYKDARKAMQYAVLFGAASIALAFPLGAFGWREIFLLVGLAFWVMAAKERDDVVSVLSLCSASTLAFGIWVLYYDMSRIENIVGGALAVINPALFALILINMPPKPDRAPQAHGVGAPV
jgi:hypothetical protein